MIRFTKMHGCGNDYIYINGFTENVGNHSDAAVKLSNRHFGVGSDGLIFINPSEKADFEMEMYNLDGSRAQMCGNGIRCVGKYVYDHGMTDKTVITVDTLAGVKTLDLKVSDGKVTEVTVDMGAPVTDPLQIPVSAEFAGSKEKIINEAITVGDSEYRVTCVSMGNPHAIVFIDCDECDIKLSEIGPLFENHKAFPERINTEFVKVRDRKRIDMRVWERGSGETFACGTGACASAVASVLNGFTEDEVTIRLQGGELRARWDRENGHVFLTGPAETVFEGTMENILEAKENFPER